MKVISVYSVIALRCVVFTWFFLTLSVQHSNASPLRQNLLPQDARLTVTHIIDGRTIAVKGGRIIRLSEILIPEHIPDAQKQAKTWLSEAIKGKDIRLYVTRDDKNGRRNRHDFELGHIETLKGEWVQAQMVERGMAVAYSTTANHDMADHLLQKEQFARDKQMGLWAKDLQLHDQISIHDHLRSFQIIEAKIYSASMRKNTVYLNFTRDWRSDLTARINKKDRLLFSREGISPLSLNGKNVRIRGYVEDYNGPMITLTHPSQIEVLD